MNYTRCPWWKSPNLSLWIWVEKQSCLSWSFSLNACALYVIILIYRQVMLHLSNYHFVSYSHTSSIFQKSVYFISRINRNCSLLSWSKTSCDALFTMDSSGVCSLEVSPCQRLMKTPASCFRSLAVVLSALRFLLASRAFLQTTFFMDTAMLPSRLVFEPRVTMVMLINSPFSAN